MVRETPILPAVVKPNTSLLSQEPDVHLTKKLNPLRKTYKTSPPKDLENPTTPRTRFTYVEGVAIDEKTLREKFREVNEASMTRCLNQLRARGIININHQNGTVGKVIDASYIPGRGVVVSGSLHCRYQLEQRLKGGKILNEEYVQWAEEQKHELLSGKIGQFSLEFQNPSQSGNEIPPSFGEVQFLGVAICRKGQRDVDDLTIVAWSDDIEG